MLLGRSREVEEIDRLLADVRAAQGRALLVTGEAGIGKTALLELARERASGVRAIEAVGIEAEANLPFAALGDIAAPLMDHLGDLPDPQADAIRAALALAEDPRPTGDRLAPCAALLGMVRSAAAPEPLLIIIDDAHWVDSSSAECIGYVARRLGGSRVALLAAARAEARAPLLEGRFPDELRLSGLQRDDALELLLASAGDLAPATAESLLDAADGNPLALIELPSLLSEEQRRGFAPFDPAPAPGGSLWEALHRRVAILGPQVRAAILVASASAGRAQAPVLDACRELAIPLEALERAEEAGVLSLRDGQVTFSHPLLRGVVYEGASGAERRRAHDALSRYADPDARPWHLAAAALGPSAEVADALEAAAHRATARGAHAAAADALERAAQFTDDIDVRTGRLLNAGLEAAVGGGYERAAALLESIADVDDPAARVAVRHLLAMVTLTGGIELALVNHRTLTEEAERIAGIDAHTAAALHADAAVSAVVAGACELALDSAGRAAAVLPQTAPDTTRCQVLSILGMTLALRGRTAEGSDALDRAGRLLGDVDALSPAAQSISFALHGRLCIGRARVLREEVLALGSAARESGGYGVVPYYLLVAADAAYRVGDWSAAERDIDEAVAIADHSAQRGPLSVALVVRARLHAARGRTGDARSDAAAAIAAAEAPGYGSTVLWAKAALGFLELGLGRTDPAIAELEQAEVLVQLAGLEDPLIVPWAPDLVEAYRRADRHEDARRLAGTLAEQARRSAVPLAEALAARCDGLVAEGSFDEAFERARDLHDGADAPFEEARTLLAWGTRLHRGRRRVEARKRLRESLDAFERLGAKPWAERARGELRAAGAIDRPPVTDPYQLTAQEARVAVEVARGGTNREVAADLFLSPKTVEFHLGRVYRKLGIRSRTELATFVAEGGIPLAGSLHLGAAQMGGPDAAVGAS